jgi:hypothetical protein
MLIREGDSSSWNFRFTKPRLVDLLDWGRLYGFIGSGNQITESGLLLRYIMGEEATNGISNRSFVINPFKLSLEEKLYFLYRHLEVDTPLYFLIKRLAEIKDEPVIGGVQGDRITCFALYDTYQLFTEQRGFSAHKLLGLKALRDVIGKMVPELDLSREIPIRNVSKPKAPSALRAKPDQRNRKRTNTSDNEAVPRLEFLTDIGLLEKKRDGESTIRIEDIHKAWRYWPTSLLTRFSERLPGEFAPELCASRFALAATAFLSGPKPKRLDSRNDPISVARRAYEAYLIVKRRFGNTSVESIGVVAMIYGLVGHEVLEVADVHQFFLDIKLKGLFPNTVRFAAGSDLNNMFLDIGSSFMDEVQTYYE